LAEVESALARGRDRLRYGEEAPENAIGENLRWMSGSTQHAREIDNE
jgi:hypothetical protein